MLRQINDHSFGDMQRVEDTRQRMYQDDLDTNPLGIMRGGRNIGGPLPDRAWDAFFGAIQRKGEDVENAGGNFNVDLVGRRGTSGIGTLKGQDPYAPAGGAIPFALKGLSRAAGYR